MSLLLNIEMNQRSPPKARPRAPRLRPAASARSRRSPSRRPPRAPGRPETRKRCREHAAEADGNSGLAARRLNTAAASSAG